MTLLAAADFNAWIALAGVAVGALGTVFIQIWTHRQQKQFIAAEKRLEAQQALFGIWWEVALNYHDDDRRRKLLGECRELWNSNCLYLGRRSRQRFSKAMNDLAIYDVYRERWKTGLDKNGENMKLLFRHITEVFPAIFDDAEIPDLHEGLIEFRKLLPDWSGDQSRPLF